LGHTRNTNRMIYGDRRDNRTARQVARRLTTLLEKRKIEGYSVTLKDGTVIVELPTVLEDAPRKTLIDAIDQLRDSGLIEIKGETTGAKRAIEDDDIAELFAESLAKFLPKETSISGISDGGVITIVGKISNAHAREAAIDLAKETPGVKKVIDKMRIPVQIRDIDLANAVIFDLSANAKIKIYHLQVFAKNGTVFLSGNAADESSTKDASDVASSVYGVKQVVNGIRLHGDSENNDDKLKKIIEKGIKDSKDVRARDIKTTVIGGNVFLRGYVKTTKEMIAAEALVSQIDGVDRVYMELEPRV